MYLVKLVEHTILEISFFITMTLIVANSKASESIVEGENESTEEKTVSKPAVKEEVETSDVKVETPELKVGKRSSL